MKFLHFFEKRSKSKFIKERWVGVHSFERLGAQMGAHSFFLCKEWERCATQKIWERSMVWCSHTWAWYFQCQYFGGKSLMWQMEWKIRLIFGLAFYASHEFAFGHLVSCQPAFQGCWIVGILITGSWTSPQPGWSNCEWNRLVVDSSNQFNLKFLFR